MAPQKTWIISVVIRRFYTLLCREIGRYFRSPLAYIVLCFYLLLTGFNFHTAVSALNANPSRFSLVEAFFNTFFFWFSFILIFPLITMRLFSEEYKLGTIEALMTAPVRGGEVVLSKFVAAVFFYIILWAPSLLYFVVFELQTGARAAGAVGPYIGGYGILLLIGMFYISIGCLASALTSNQFAAAVISFVLITLLFFLGLLSSFAPNISLFLRDLTGYVSTSQHMTEFSQGLFDTRPVVFYVSMLALTLYLTFQVFQYRNWRS